MKSSIKLKAGEKLNRLLSKPKALSALIEIALKQSEDSGLVELAEISADKETIDFLVIADLVVLNDYMVGLADKSVVDITLKRVSKQKLEIDSMLLKDVKVKDVPDSLKNYYLVASSFQKLFYTNLKRLDARVENVKNAKFGKWVTPIRLMVENDKVTKEQFKQVFNFLDSHDFWSDKVQSTEKLRKKFDTLYSQLKTNEKKGKSTAKDRGSKSTGSKVSPDYVRGIIDRLQSSGNDKRAEQG